MSSSSTRIHPELRGGSSRLARRPERLANAPGCRLPSLSQKLTNQDGGVQARPLPLRVSTCCAPASPGTELFRDPRLQVPDNPGTLNGYIRPWKTKTNVSHTKGHRSFLASCLWPWCSPQAPFSKLALVQEVASHAVHEMAHTGMSEA